MTLLDSTRKALDFTRRLEAALALNDLDMCQEILELRGAAMAAFEQAHRRADVSERNACAGEIRALAQADGELQAKMAVALDLTARSFRENMTSGHGNATARYQNGPAQACIDRKA